MRSLIVPQNRCGIYRVYPPHRDILVCLSKKGLEKIEKKLVGGRIIKTKTPWYSWWLLCGIIGRERLFLNWLQTCVVYQRIAVNDIFLLVCVLRAGAQTSLPFGRDY